MRRSPEKIRQASSMRGAAAPTVRSAMPIGTLVELDNHSLREAPQTTKPSEFLVINAGNQR